MDKKEILKIASKKQRDERKYSILIESYRISYIAILILLIIFQAIDIFKDNFGFNHRYMLIIIVALLSQSLYKFVLLKNKKDLIGISILFIALVLTLLSLVI